MSAQLVDPELDGDPVLLSRVRAGDTDAYGLLFERHRHAAVAFAGRLAGKANADDLVAEAFAKVLDALQRDLGPRVSFRAYLLTSIRSIWVNTVRSKRRLTVVDDFDGISGADELQVVDDPDQRFDHQAVAEAYRTLPERWQAVLWYTAVEGLPHSEVAVHLGIKPNAVAALGFRAREGLRQAYLAAHLAKAPDPSCQTWASLLPAYARGSLDRRKRAGLDAHLDGCLACTTALAELHEVDDRLGALLLPIVLGPGLLAAPGLWNGLATSGLSASSASSGAGTTATVTSKLAALMASSTVGLATAAAAVAVGASLALPSALDVTDRDGRPGLSEAVTSERQVRGDGLQGPTYDPSAVRPSAVSTPTAAAEPRPRPQPSSDVPTRRPHEADPGHAQLVLPASPPPQETPDDVAGAHPATPVETPETPELPGPSPDAALGPITTRTIAVGDVIFTRAEIPVTNLRPGTVIDVVATNLLGRLWLQGSGWSCPGTVDGVLDQADLVPTTRVSCTWLGAESSEEALVFHLLAHGHSDLTATIVELPGADDPMIENNTTSTTITP